MTAGARLLPEGTRLVHIGPHKTGSTAIQVALDSAAERLAAHDVAYVTVGSYRPRKAGWALGIRGRPAGTERPPMKHWKRFVTAVEASTAGRVCVSNEDFGRATQRQAARVVADLGGDRVHVVAVARRLDRYLPSQWQERVKAGDERGYDEWLRVVLDTDDPAPDWDRHNVWFSHDVRALAERWVDVVGPERFTVIVLDESDRDQLPRTFEQMLGLPPGLVVPDTSRSNRGLSWAETELVRATSAILADAGWERPRRRRAIGPTVLRDMAGRAAPAGPKSPPAPEWAAARIRALSDQRVADLHALAARGVHLVGDPELMCMPADAPVAGTNAGDTALPPLEVEVAARALASVLVAAVPEPARPDEPDAE
ncbi:hypothetical protein [Nocardioides cynanchi]|uniref:hypothetical protein n=1 Tax=Nocardioides cynanchi TaxID=2558918 RepID=UPI00124673A0|nr:hypothetical protein [Nocardioides cynanchi]